MDAYESQRLTDYEAGAERSATDETLARDNEWARNLEGRSADAGVRNRGRIAAQRIGQERRLRGAWAGVSVTPRSYAEGVARQAQARGLSPAEYARLR